MEVILITLLIGGIFFGVSGAVAMSRGHSFILFGLLGLFISPVLAIILAFIITGKTSSSSRRVVRRIPKNTNNAPRGNIKNPYKSPGGSAQVTPSRRYSR